MKNVIFLTGATGLVGNNPIQCIPRDELGHRQVLLLHRKSEDDSRRPRIAIPRAAMQKSTICVIDSSNDLGLVEFGDHFIRLRDKKS